MTERFDMLWCLVQPELLPDVRPVRWLTDEHEAKRWAGLQGYVAIGIPIMGLYDARGAGGPVELHERT